MDGTAVRYPGLQSGELQFNGNTLNRVFENNFVRFPHLKKCDLLFDYSFTKKNSLFLLEWFNNYKILEEVLDLFSAEYYFRTNIETIFLNIARALEVFHRRTVKDYDITKEEYKQILDEISSKLPQHSAWLQSKLQFAYQFSFPKRLDFIIKKTQAVLLCFFKDLDEQRKIITNMRNYLVHLPEGKPYVEVTSNDFFHCILKMKMILIVLVMKQIKIDDSSIIELLSKAISNYHLSI